MRKRNKDKKALPMKIIPKYQKPKILLIDLPSTVLGSQWGLLDRLILFALNSYKRRSFAGIAETLQQTVKR